MSTTIYDGGNQVVVIHAPAPTPPPNAPTITAMTLTPNSLPIGGGMVTISANTTNTTGVTYKVEGVDKGPITLPATVPIT